MMRVVIVDDQELLRRGLSLLLSTESEVNVVGQAANGIDALSVIADTRPDVVLSDARMPRMDGIELVTAMRASHPEIPTIILTTFDDDDLVRRAIAAGASGFLLKDSSTDDLVQAMRAALEGGLVIDPRVARIAFSRSPESMDVDAPSDGPLAVLTRAERVVAAQVATGANNSEIAANLFLAEGTVKNHVSVLLRKLDQRDRTGLALLLFPYFNESPD